MKNGTRQRLAEDRRASRPAGPSIGVPPDNVSIDPEARARAPGARLRSGSGGATNGHRADPKDKKEEASRLAQVTSGELQGKELGDRIARDPEDRSGQPAGQLATRLRAGRIECCRDAVPHFRSAITAHLPSADAHLGLAGCEAAERRFDSAAGTLRDAERIEPGNPVVAANLGIVPDGGHPTDALVPLQRALTLDPDLHQARFSLAIAYARRTTGEAASTAEDLLRRLPADASQRSEVERLIKARETDMCPPSPRLRRVCRSATREGGRVRYLHFDHASY
jgi:Flp pilus assembly protein TadD